MQRAATVSDAGTDRGIRPECQEQGTTAGEERAAAIGQSRNPAVGGSFLPEIGNVVGTFLVVAQKQSYHSTSLYCFSCVVRVLRLAIVPVTTVARWFPPPKCLPSAPTSASPRKNRAQDKTVDILRAIGLTSYSYGESHCLSVGCIVDGVPPGMRLTEADIQPQMTRRRPGQSAITTPRNEKDRVEIQSGTEFGITLGTPIGMRVMNENQRPKDYGNNTMDRFPRPSHADWTYLEKYGVKASSGGGRSSARETIGQL